MSPNRTICDTDTLSEIFKSVDPRVVHRAAAYLDEHPSLSFASPTVMEILYGLYRKNAFSQIRRTLEALEIHEEILPHRGDYRLAAEIMGALDRRGTPIGRIDPLIAACALNRNLTLATGNLRHFGFIQSAGYSLRLEDWRQA